MALLIVVLLLIAFFLLSCLPGPNDLQGAPDKEGKIAGFWRGLWHGLLAPITFLISIFSQKVNFYEVHNNGFWYNLGFVLGAGLFLNGGILGSWKARRARKKRI
jgi:hypothetical protein